MFPSNIKSIYEALTEEQKQELVPVQQKYAAVVAEDLKKGMPGTVLYMLLGLTALLCLQPEYNGESK